MSRSGIQALEEHVARLAQSDATFGGSRLIGVEVDFVGPVRVISDKATAQSDQAIREALSSFATSQYTISYGNPFGMPMVGRVDDAAPYKGGAALLPAAGGFCSSGYMARSTGNGAVYMLTAEHCVNNNDPRFWDGGDDFVGSATARDGRYDVAAIKVAGSARIFTGTWANSWYTPVDGVVKPANAVFQEVCTGGAASGTLCNGATIRSYAHVYDGGWTTSSEQYWPDLILWSARVHNAPKGYSTFGPIMGEGDSGGPVYIATHQTGGLMNAVGLVSSRIEGYPVTACGESNPQAGYRTCFSDLWFSDVQVDAANWQLDLTF